MAFFKKNYRMGSFAGQTLERNGLACDCRLLQRLVRALSYDGAHLQKGRGGICKKLI